MGNITDIFTEQNVCDVLVKNGYEGVMCLAEAPTKTANEPCACDVDDFMPCCKDTLELADKGAQCYPCRFDIKGERYYVEMGAPTLYQLIMQDAIQNKEVSDA